MNVDLVNYDKVCIAPMIAAAMRPFVKLLLETVRGVVLKKKWGTPETRLRERFLNNLGLHTRTLIHVRKCHSGSLVLSCDTATRV